MNRWTAGILLTGALLLVPFGGAAAASGPRPLSAAERAAVEIAIAYLSTGEAVWWERLAERAPLRRLGRDAALAEILARVGPAEGAIWRLGTLPPERGSTAIFSIDYPSGFDETVVLRMTSEADGWKIGEIRCRVDPVRGPLHRLGSLVALRRALAIGSREEVEPLLDQVPNGAAGRAVRLWQAQYRLRHADAAGAISTLNDVAQAREQGGEALPLASLLNARLALLRNDSLVMAVAYDEAIQQGIDHDALRLESLESQALLGFLDEEGYRDLARMGSRLAAVYYTMARVAIFHEEDAASMLFLTGWRLEPLERSSFFDDPMLTQIALEPEVFAALELGAAAEPRLGPVTSQLAPLATFGSAQALVAGNQLTLLVGDARVEVPGGGALAPPGTAWEDAGARRRRRQDAALAALADLIAATDSSTTLTNPLLRRRLETAAGGLIDTKRWADLVRLTDGIAADMDKAGPILGRARGLALTRLGRDREAILLLRQLADSDRDAQRRSPGVLYQLAELAADHRRYDLAISLIKKADAMSPLAESSSRLIQLEVDRLLEKNAKVHETPNFLVRYAPMYTREYISWIATVLEDELKRLGKWVPIRAARQREVAIVPGGVFELAYGSGVLGLFDGRIRVPVFEKMGRDEIDTDTLAHELTHALISEYAGEDVPAWFHEGLAQHLEKAPVRDNPIPGFHEKERLMSLPVVDTVLDGYGPRDMTIQAYHESAWALHYIQQRYGQRGIRGMLDAFAAGHGTEGALAAALKTRLGAFDQALWRWCLSDASWAVLDDSPEEIKTPQVGIQLNPEIAEMVDEHLDGMREWYRYYTAKVRPVKKALRFVVGGMRGDTSVKMSVVCGQLDAEAAAVVSDPKVFAVDDHELKAMLRRAYIHFRNVGSACRQGQYGRVTAELGLAEQALGKAQTLLKPYGLTP